VTYNLFAEFVAFHEMDGQTMLHNSLSVVQGFGEVFPISSKYEALLNTSNINLNICCDTFLFWS